MGERSICWGEVVLGSFQCVVHSEEEDASLGAQPAMTICIPRSHVPCLDYLSMKNFKSKWLFPTIAPRNYQRLRALPWSCLQS